MLARVIHFFNPGASAEDVDKQVMQRPDAVESFGAWAADLRRTWPAIEIFVRGQPVTDQAPEGYLPALRGGRGIPGTRKSTED